MKKTILFATLCIASMMLFVSCQEKPEIAEIKTAKSYLANHYIFGLLETESISEYLPEDFDDNFALSLAFDENGEAKSNSSWIVDSFEGAESEMKYSISYNLAKIENDEPTGLEYNVEVDIDVVNSTLANISGTLTWKEDELEKKVSLKGGANISELPPRWLLDYRWNSKEVMDGEEIIDSIIAQYANTFCPADYSVDVKMRNAGNDFTAALTLDLASGGSSHEITFKKPTNNDYEITSVDTSTEYANSIEGNTSIKITKTPLLMTRIDDLPEWTKDYFSLLDMTNKDELAFDYNYIGNTDIQCAILNNGNGTFTYILYSTKYEWDENNILVQNVYKTYYEVENTESEIVANRKKVLLGKDGTETLIEDNAEVTLIIVPRS